MSPPQHITTQECIALAMPEADLQANTIELAEALGWAVWHARDSRGQRLTGLPDLLCAKPPVSFWAELKREGKDPTPMQDVVLDIFRRCGWTVYIWHPSDWLDGTIQKVLEGKV